VPIVIIPIKRNIIVALLSKEEWNLGLSFLTITECALHFAILGLWLYWELLRNAINKDQTTIALNIQQEYEIRGFIHACT
jgi:hypothetical protein